MLQTRGEESGGGVTCRHYAARPNGRLQHFLWSNPIRNEGGQANARVLSDVNLVVRLKYHVGPNIAFANCGEIDAERLGRGAAGDVATDNTHLEVGVSREAAGPLQQFADPLGAVIFDGA